MKDQYFGDINDYRKYGLLRALQSRIGGRLLIAWMLTPDDGSRDGGKRSYLQDPARWRHYDPEHFDGLAQLLASAATPRVSLIAAADLLPQTSYYSVVVPDGRAARDGWRQGLLDAVCNADLVFVDPDNGIEVPSKPIGRRGSSKYVTWDELAALWAGGSSVLIYQHYPRQPHQLFAERIAAKLQACTGARVVRGFQTARVLFLLAVQERHAAKVSDAVSLLQAQWHQQITAVELAQEPSIAVP